MFDYRMARYKSGLIVHPRDEILLPGRRRAKIKYTFGSRSDLALEYGCTGPGVMIEEEVDGKKQTRVFDVNVSPEWQEVTIAYGPPE
jgi:hypothetical protein